MSLREEWVLDTGGIGNGANVDYNTFDIRQNGYSNFANQTIEGNDFAGEVNEINNYGWISQIGEHNTAYQLMGVVEGGTMDNKAYADQFGINNYSAQYQRAAGGSISDHNQWGNHNSEITFQNW